MNYKEAMDYIESIQHYGCVPGLENIRYLCENLGNPQDRLQFVHIAGTNGKGSVLAYLSTVLQAAGYKVGDIFPRRFRTIGNASRSIGKRFRGPLFANI